MTGAPPNQGGDKEPPLAGRGGAPRVALPTGRRPARAARTRPLLADARIWAARARGPPGCQSRAAELGEAGVATAAAAAAAAVAAMGPQREICG